MNNGNEYSIDDAFLEILSNPLTNVTFSGGDLFIQAKEASMLAERVKKAGKNLWCYTGFTLEQLENSEEEDHQKLLSFIDTLVDGRFIIAEKDISLPLRGSRNQRIIHLIQEK
ncbi:4Fe-4S single cluster domain-containing protein [Bacillus sp. MRMR6]|uniref:4Fe-4S single cluster domain-containing protein n=1 Tax=Bacillus sp. MRMR6 TaxID=1928617 RepID=UPI000952A3C9|nr:hypothetical protein BTR25_22155 [Bacillus sp. MRMR6]